MLALASDRTPAPLWKRLFGADFRQVGFIRRNALISLADLELWDESLRELLIKVLREDPYYETRAAAAEVILTLKDKIGSCKKLAAALEANLEHYSLEVRWKSLEALGAVTPNPKLLDNIQRFLLMPFYWIAP